MTKVIKTTFEEEQKAKDEAWLALTPSNVGSGRITSES
jgi:hypothetical protein